MKVVLSFLLTIFVFSSIAFLYVLFKLPPKTGSELNVINLVYFFLSGLVSVASGLSLVLYSAELVFAGKKRAFVAVETSKTKLRLALRRSLIASLIITLIFLLRLLGLGNGLNLALVIVAGVLVEIYFSNR